jgi:hypothetical protein
MFGVSRHHPKKTKHMHVGIAIGIGVGFYKRHSKKELIFFDPDSDPDMSRDTSATHEFN